MARVLALTGFMGSGKSTLGTVLARRLGWAFRDLDEVVEKSTGRSPAHIFADEGESGFRRVEMDSLAALLATPPGDLVLALGGGAVVSPEVRALLAGHAFTVHLHAAPEVCWARVAHGETRPLARDKEEFLELARRRAPMYAAVAQAVILAEGPIDELARKVEEALPGAFAAHPRERRDVRERGWRLVLRQTSRESLLVGGQGSLEALAEIARREAARGRRARVVSDHHVWGLWGERVADCLGPLVGESPPYLLDPGERSKTVGQAGHGWDWLAAEGLRRDDLVVSVGGGVVGDLAGFVAATYLRGIDLWQVPTSLLAQVDSSVGGKVAVNLDAGKNLVGSFYQADLVILDPEFLTTLPPGELENGLGEVVKYGLLVGEPLLSSLERQAGSLRSGSEDVLEQVVQRCVRYKAAVVEMDEREAGLRAVLNLGHTAGHALETVAGYGGLAHGRAVGLGLLVALALSESTLGLDRGLRPRIRGLLERLDLPTGASLPADIDLRRLLARDKKVSAAGMGFVGLRAPGEPVPGVDASWDEVREAMEVLR